MKIILELLPIVFIIIFAIEYALIAEKEKKIEREKISDEIIKKMKKDEENKKRG